MRILFYRYNSICEPDMIEAMKSLGNEIVEIREEMENKNFTLQECVALVGKTLLESQFDMVFSVNFYPALSEVCQICKIRYVSWIVDCPVLELYSYAIRNEWNRIFIFDYALYLDFVKENPDCIFYLPLAVNVGNSDRARSLIGESERKNYTSDITFIGSLYTEKSPFRKIEGLPEYLKGYFNGIIEAQLKVYGYSFIEELLNDDMVESFKKQVPQFYQFPEKAIHDDKAVTAHSYLGMEVTARERLNLLSALSEEFSLQIYTYSDTSSIPKAWNRGGAESKLQMPQIFALSKINLNITARPIRTGLPQRIWDVIGAGGFLLTNYQSELEDYFEIGKEIDVFGSEQELLEKTAYYLSHDKERVEMSKRAYEKVKTYHTYSQRMQQLLQMAWER